MKIYEIDSEKEMQLFNRKVTNSKTFYIYSYDEEFCLFIVNGIQTDPPLSPSLYKQDLENYSKVFTIPKGIIHKHHADWISDDICDRLYNEKFVILTERNDKKARSILKEVYKV